MHQGDHGGSNRQLTIHSDTHNQHNGQIPGGMADLKEVTEGAVEMIAEAWQEKRHMQTE